MCTYLGAFPFPSLAPCIVTREALLKVITLLTGRHSRVLKGGHQDRNTLLFRSLAIFDRLNDPDKSFPSEKETAREAKDEKPTVTGFAIDQPDDEAEDEDDDGLVLAALDALDAIEVFGDLQKSTRKIHRAHIPVKNLERLLMLMLAFAPLTVQGNIAQCCGRMEPAYNAALERSVRSILSAFDHDRELISYTKFMRAVTTVVPHILRPLDPLFSHFLFSKDLDLSKVKEGGTAEIPSRRSKIPYLPQDETTLLNDVLLAQISTSLEITNTSSPELSSLFHCNAQYDVLYSSAKDGTSMSSFGRQVMSWRAATFLLIRAVASESEQSYVFGAFLPDHWKELGTSTQGDSTGEFKATMFQLLPRHAIFRANPYNKSTPVSYFSPKTGIALGCIVPVASRIHAADQEPVLCNASLYIDADMSTATFQHDGNAGSGAFLTDPLLEESQLKSPAQPKRLVLDIDVSEVWGVSFPGGKGGEDEIVKQKKRLDWEEAEAARRRGVNFGGDKDGARHLLEMAGIVNTDTRSGGSMS